MSTKSILKSLNPMTAFQTKSVFKSVCDEHGLVYFGRVNQFDDEHELVKGITFSSNHRDNHYVVGTAHGYDVILVERSDKVTFPGKPEEEYSWIILQVDLHSHIQLAQTFFDAQHHDANFYSAIFAKFNRLSPADHVFDQSYDKLFSHRFRVYTPPDAADVLPLLVTPETAATMAHHFGHFDVEWHGDRLIIYSTGRPATKHLINTMIREGVWLANTLENIFIVHGNSPELPLPSRQPE